MVLLIFALNIIRGTTDQFISGYGLYNDIWAPIVEVIIFIVVAFIGGYYWELEGLLLGNIVSLLIIIYGWKPYFLFKYGFKISIWKYLLNMFKYIIITYLSYIVFVLINSKLDLHFTNSSWGAFLHYCLYIGTSYSILLFFFLYLGTKDMKNVIKRFSIKKE